MHWDRLRLRRIAASALMCMALIGSASALPSGIGGQQVGDDDVAIAGCTCHAEDPDNSITVILDGLPYHYELGKSYPLLLQIIGGPDADTSSYTGGFAMRVDGGLLSLAILHTCRTGTMTTRPSLTPSKVARWLKEHGILNGRRQQKKKALSHSG